MINLDGTNNKNKQLKTAKNKYGAGAPRKKIDWEQVDQLCYIQCTEAEIAAVLNIGVETLSQYTKTEKGVNFCDYMAEKSKVGKMSLRRRQFKTAENNPTMQIWLGKQYLKQKENLDITSDLNVTINFADGDD